MSVQFQSSAHVTQASNKLDNRSNSVRKRTVLATIMHNMFKVMIVASRQHTHNTPPRPHSANDGKLVGGCAVQPEWGH